MEKQSRNGISEFSEISDRQSGDGFGNFAAAVGWGTLAGTAGLMMSIALAAFSGPYSPAVYASLLSAVLFLGLFVGAYTLAGMVAIGLPVTLALSITESENQPLYAAVGTFAGFIVMMILFGQNSHIGPEEFFFAVPGGCAGLASGWRWGGWRERRATAHAHNPFSNPQPED